ncbi:MAG: hypothetical protein H7328_11710 [Bdellovibrio sp.]|nr:hypothetical protein [Bdellovibrio sp.]
MNFLIILMMSFFLMLVNQVCFADTLLVPEANVPFLTYRESCEKNSYVCTDKFFFDRYVAKETPQFDELVNSIDLSANVYIQNYAKSLTTVLQNEMLSEEQLEMALKLTTQVKELIANKNQLTMLETELKKIKDFLTKIPNPVAVESFVIFFKKKMTQDDFKNFKSSLLKVPGVFIKYASLPEEISTRSKITDSQVSLLTGACESAQLTKDLNIVGWQPLAVGHCSFSEGVSAASKSVTQTLSNNKKWIVTGAVVLGAVLLLNHYEVQFQF